MKRLPVVAMQQEVNMRNPIAVLTTLLALLAEPGAT